MPAPFECSLVTPERAVLDAKATYADLPAHDGQIGVMHLRAPMIIKLGVGRLRLDIAEGQSQQYVIDGGFAEMTDNKLTILTDQALTAGDIDTTATQAALAEAKAIKPATEELFTKRQHDIALAEAMLSLAK